MRVSRGPRMDHTNPKRRVTGSRTGTWDWSGQPKSSGDFAAQSKKEDFTCSSRISRCKKTYVGLLKVILPTIWTQAIYHRKEQNKKHKHRDNWSWEKESMRKLSQLWNPKIQDHLKPTPSLGFLDPPETINYDTSAGVPSLTLCGLLSGNRHMSNIIFSLKTRKYLLAVPKRLL